MPEYVNYTPSDSAKCRRRRQEESTWTGPLKESFMQQGVSVCMRLCGSRAESLKQCVGVEHPEDKGFTGLLTIPDGKEEE